MGYAFKPRRFITACSVPLWAGHQRSPQECHQSSLHCHPLTPEHPTWVPLQLAVPAPALFAADLACFVTAACGQQQIAAVLTSQSRCHRHCCCRRLVPCCRTQHLLLLELVLLVHRQMLSAAQCLLQPLSTAAPQEWCCLGCLAHGPCHSTGRAALVLLAGCWCCWHLDLAGLQRQCQSAPPAATPLSAVRSLRSSPGCQGWQ